MKKLSLMSGMKRIKVVLTRLILEVRKVKEVKKRGRPQI